MQTDYKGSFIGRGDKRGRERGQRKGQRGTGLEAGQRPVCLFRRTADKRMEIGKACLLKEPFAPVQQP